MRLLSALLGAVLVLAAPSAAHVTVTVEPVSAPLVVGQPTDVTVHFSEPCFEVIPQEAQGQDTVQAGLAPEAPATFAWVGEEVPFTTDLCDPTAVPLALVRATANLTITPGADAPGLTNLTLPVTSYLGGGDDPGETVDLELTVAHHANGTLTAAPATGGHGDHGAGGNGTAIALVLDYTTNAESLLTFEATASTGEVHEIDAIAVSPPSFGNKPSDVVEATALFEAPAEWTSADLTFTAYLTPTVGGARIAVGTASLALEHGADDGAHGDGHDADDHTHDEEGAPGPGLALVALAIVAAALRRR